MGQDASQCGGGGEVGNSLTLPRDAFERRSYIRDPELRPNQHQALSWYVCPVLLILCVFLECNAS